MNCRLNVFQAVTVSYKDKLDLSIGVAVGSSIQIALFVIPVLVLVGRFVESEHRAYAKSTP